MLAPNSDSKLKNDNSQPLEIVDNFGIRKIKFQGTISIKEL